MLRPSSKGTNFVTLILCNLYKYKDNENVAKTQAINLSSYLSCKWVMDEEIQVNTQLRDVWFMRFEAD